MKPRSGSVNRPNDSNYRVNLISPPLVSFQTIPSRLMLVPGSQAPRDSGSVTVPTSAVLLAICNRKIFNHFNREDSDVWLTGINC